MKALITVNTADGFGYLQHDGRVFSNASPVRHITHFHYFDTHVAIFRDDPDNTSIKNHPICVPYRNLVAITPTGEDDDENANSSPTDRGSTNISLHEKPY